MTRNAGRLLEEALRLSEDERAELAALLMDSLDPEVDEDLHPAWRDEIGMRLEELDRGLVPLVPWSKARELILNDGDESDSH